MFDCIFKLVPIPNNENDEHTLPMYIIEQNEAPLLKVIDDILLEKESGAIVGISRSLAGG